MSSTLKGVGARVASALWEIVPVIILAIVCAIAAACVLWSVLTIGGWR